MSSNNNTKARGSKSKHKTVLAPPASGENKSELSPDIPFGKLAKYPDDNEETVSIKRHISDTVSKDDKKNYETNSFKLIKTFGYSCTTVVKIICDIDLDIFILYALNSPIIVKKRLKPFSRVLKGNIETQFIEATRECQNQLLNEYDDEATLEILGRRKYYISSKIRYPLVLLKKHKNT